MEQKSEVRCAIEELSMIAVAKHGDNDDTAFVSTEPFLSVCNLVLQVLDKIGPTMAVLRQDISQNIERLEVVHKSNPSMNSNLVEILKTEASIGNAKKGPSCSKAFVWLTRSLDFALALLQSVAEDGGKNMEDVVEECYNNTLKPWHGWISSAAFRVALKLVPDSQTFVDVLKAKDENYETLKEEMQALVSLLGPFLHDVHCILEVYNLDKLKST
ncbi:glycolipid transfer protein 3-like [Prosopis cineraria]|uniref:glycolipid transfer protein 3-like n=1 Tax=Prosopis cineraria TaxID=364024 RepID=UPI00240FBC3B|nr:glycolipid transfer protein 3-like [Prosopis cineraria]